MQVFVMNHEEPMAFFRSRADGMERTGSVSACSVSIWHPPVGLFQPPSPSARPPSGAFAVRLKSFLLPLGEMCQQEIFFGRKLFLARFPRYLFFMGTNSFAEIKCVVVEVRKVRLCHDQPCREVCLASAAFPLQKLLQCCVKAICYPGTHC